MDQIYKLSLTFLLIIKKMDIFLIWSIVNEFARYIAYNIVFQDRSEVEGERF